MAAGNLPQGPEVVVGEQPNMVFLNDGTGHALPRRERPHRRRRRAASRRGSAFADYDSDGAIDVFVVNQAGSPRLYRNVTPRGRQPLARRSTRSARCRTATDAARW